MVTLEAFIEDLSSGAPTPGGGSVAALHTALAASLLIMVANLTEGKKRYADVEDRVRQTREASEGLRDRAMALIAEDAEAFAAFSRALSLPKGSDSEKHARHETMQSALKGAAGPPLEVMALAFQVVRQAEILLDIGNVSAVSDVGVAVLSAVAGYRAARLNVDINLSSVVDQEWVRDVRDRMQSMPDVEGVQRSVLQRVEAKIRGEVL